MALIKCPECGKEISDQAHNCPNCGYPINPAPLNDSVDEVKDIKSKYDEAVTRMSSCSSSNDWEDLVRTFSSCADFLDARQNIEICQKKYQEAINNEQIMLSQKMRKRKKVLFWACGTLLSCALIYLLLSFVWPFISYQIAGKAYALEKYSMAADMYAAAGNYSDAQQKVNVSKEIATRAKHYYIICQINDDGSVTLAGTIEFSRYTNYSDISQGLETGDKTVTFSVNAAEIPSGLMVDPYTELTFSNGQFSIEYSQTEENRDVFFDYIYESSFQYGTLVTAY